MYHFFSCNIKLFRFFLFVCLSLFPIVPAYSACPKILMFDGVDPRVQLTVKYSKYWGETVGVQGFFVNQLMDHWQVDVGSKPTSRYWERAKEFQTLYSRFGVTSNFVKVANYKKPEWKNPKAIARIVANFRNVAAMAKYAGMKGVALDLEPYVPMWGGEIKGQGMSQQIEKVGAEIGNAMHKAYPSMTLVLVKDVLYRLRMNMGMAHGGFRLAPYFVKGLLSAGFKHVVIAEEQTYYNPRIGQVVREVRKNYRAFIRNNGLPPTSLSVAPALWPLGKSYHDKSARMTPSNFRQDMEKAFSLNVPYVWIYGYGSAWQTGGSWGKTPVIRDFSLYTKILHTVRNKCLSAARNHSH